MQIINNVLGLVVILVRAYVIGCLIDLILSRVFSIVLFFVQVSRINDVLGLQQDNKLKYIVNKV